VFEVTQRKHTSDDNNSDVDSVVTASSTDNDAADDDGYNDASSTATGDLITKFVEKSKTSTKNAPDVSTTDNTAVVHKFTSAVVQGAVEKYTSDQDKRKRKRTSDDKSDGNSTAVDAHVALSAGNTTSTTRRKDDSTDVCDEDGRKLTSYEQRRQERIKRNNEQLAQLGLLTTGSKLITQEKKTPPKKKNVDPLPKQKTIPRQSKRITTYTNSADSASDLSDSTLSPSDLSEPESPSTRRLHTNVDAKSKIRKHTKS
jgi:hypothetical protein